VIRGSDQCQLWRAVWLLGRHATVTRAGQPGPLATTRVLSRRVVVGAQQCGPHPLPPWGVLVHTR
jgi:hypothetical protein